MSTQAVLSTLLLLTNPGDQAVENLIEEVRSHMSIMFKICEAVGLLDMVCSTLNGAHLTELIELDRFLCPIGDCQRLQ
jgi:hypothetical protein